MFETLDFWSQSLFLRHNSHLQRRNEISLPLNHFNRRLANGYLSFYRFDNDVNDPILVLNGHAGARWQTNAIGKQFIRNAPTFLMRVIRHPVKHRMQMKQLPYRTCFNIFLRKRINNIHWHHAKRFWIDRQRRQPVVGYRIFQFENNIDEDYNYQ
jgi:hypothetical protein